MRLIDVLKLIPLRNETGEIYKWEEERNLLSPLQISRVRFEKNLERVVVMLNNGEHIPVDETLEELNRKFNAATS